MEEPNKGAKSILKLGDFSGKDENAASKTTSRAPTKRISFTGTNSIRVFNGAEEARTWHNSYEISEQEKSGTGLVDVHQRRIGLRSRRVIIDSQCIKATSFKKTAKSRAGPSKDKRNHFRETDTLNDINDSLAFVNSIEDIDKPQQSAPITGNSVDVTLLGHENISNLPSFSICETEREEIRHTKNTKTTTTDDSILQVSPVKEECYETHRRKYEKAYSLRDEVPITNMTEISVPSYCTEMDQSNMAIIEHGAKNCKNYTQFRFEDMEISCCESDMELHKAYNESSPVIELKMSKDCVEMDLSVSHGENVVEYSWALSGTVANTSNNKEARKAERVRTNTGATIPNNDEMDISTNTAVALFSELSLQESYSSCSSPKSMLSYTDEPSFGQLNELYTSGELNLLSKNIAIHAIEKSCENTLNFSNQMEISGTEDSNKEEEPTSGTDLFGADCFENMNAEVNSNNRSIPFPQNKQNTIYLNERMDETLDKVDLPLETTRHKTESCMKLDYCQKAQIGFSKNNSAINDSHLVSTGHDNSGGPANHEEKKYTAKSPIRTSETICDEVLISLSSIGGTVQRKTTCIAPIFDGTPHRSILEFEKTEPNKEMNKTKYETTSKIGIVPSLNSSSDLKQLLSDVSGQLPVQKVENSRISISNATNGISDIKLELSPSEKLQTTIYEGYIFEESFAGNAKPEEFKISTRRAMKSRKTNLISEDMDFDYQRWSHDNISCLGDGGIVETLVQEVKAEDNPNPVLENSVFSDNNNVVAMNLDSVGGTEQRKSTYLAPMFDGTPHNKIGIVSSLNCSADESSCVFAGCPFQNVVNSEISIRDITNEISNMQVQLSSSEKRHFGESVASDVTLEEPKNSTQKTKKSRQSNLISEDMDLDYQSCSHETILCLGKRGTNETFVEEMKAEDNLNVLENSVFSDNNNVVAMNLDSVGETEQRKPTYLAPMFDGTPHNKIGIVSSPNWSEKRHTTIYQDRIFEESVANDVTPEEPKNSTQRIRKRRQTNLISEDMDLNYESCSHETILYLGKCGTNETFVEEMKAEDNLNVLENSVFSDNNNVVAMNLDSVGGTEQRKSTYLAPMFDGTPHNKIGIVSSPNWSEKRHTTIYQDRIFEESVANDVTPEEPKNSTQRIRKRRQTNLISEDMDLNYESCSHETILYLGKCGTNETFVEEIKSERKPNAVPEHSDLSNNNNILSEIAINLSNLSETEPEVEKSERKSEIDETTNKTRTVSSLNDVENSEISIRDVIRENSNIKSQLSPSEKWQTTIYEDCIFEELLASELTLGESEKSTRRSMKGRQTNLISEHMDLDYKSWSHRSIACLDQHGTDETISQDVHADDKQHPVDEISALSINNNVLPEVRDAIHMSIYKAVSGSLPRQATSLIQPTEPVSPGEKLKLSTILQQPVELVTDFATCYEASKISNIEDEDLSYLKNLGISAKKETERIISPVLRGGRIIKDAETLCSLLEPVAEDYIVKANLSLVRIPSNGETQHQAMCLYPKDGEKLGSRLSKEAESNTLNEKRHYLCRKCRQSQETLNSSTMSTITSSPILLERCPLNPVNLALLRSLRKLPTIVDVFKHYDQLHLELTRNPKNFPISGESLEDENSLEKVESIIKNNKCKIQSIKNKFGCEKPIGGSNYFVDILADFQREHLSKWTVDYQVQYFKWIQLNHNRLMTFRLQLHYDERGSDYSFETTCLRVQKSRFLQKNWKPIDHIMEFQRKLEFPLDFRIQGEDGGEKIFRILRQVDEICTAVHSLGTSLWKIVCAERAALIRCGKTILVRKTVRNVTSVDSPCPLVNKAVFEVEIRNIRDLGFQDIVLPPLYMFREEIQSLPKGLDFLRVFLRNPSYYLK